MEKYMLALAMLCFACCKQPAQNKTNGKIAAITDTTNIGHAPYTKAYSAPERIDGLPEKLAAFVPAGYEALDTASGDLNLDAYPDIILVLKRNGEDTVSDMNYDAPVKRPLLILIGAADGNYQLAARNDNAVLCYNCSGMFGDAFTGVSIKHGYFSIEHSIAGGQHWESATTFKYDKGKNDWFLYKEGYISYRMNDNTSADAEALVKDVESQKTVKDFGMVPFGKYDTYTEK